MTRLFPADFARLVVQCAVFAMFFLTLPVSAHLLQPSGDTILHGRLATVEPSARRLTVVPDGEANVVEIFVAEDAEVQTAERPLTLSELVIEVGRRLSVTYRMDGQRRVARQITVDPA